MVKVEFQIGKKEAISEFMRRWEGYIREDLALQKRLKNPYHYQEFYENPPAFGGVAMKDLARLPPEELEGRELIEVSLPESSVTYVVEVKKGKFRIREGRAKKAILSLVMSLDVFKRMVLMEERVTWSILDERCKLTFDTTSWTYYDGITILEILVCAQELVEKESEVAEIVKEL